uniref:Uncharacterized protein n=1 Tax=Tanacetum cinerariifolium TaxID=118510 RepID=A0A6L2KQE2_TANCI|nr:hypothetical protein [Tanacetum cinerariifolium]
MNDLESDDESVDTPLVSPFPHSNNDSDDGEVLNELIEYENVGMLPREKAINSFDGDDLAFPLPEESSHWQYKFPLPVKVVPTARRLEMPLSGVCTAIEEMMKKLPVKDRWQVNREDNDKEAEDGILYGCDQKQLGVEVEDFIPMGLKEETERLKRKGLNLKKEQVKKQKLSEEAPKIETSTEEFTEEKMKEMMQLVPVEDVYVQALQVKHPIIDWKVHTEGQRSYWQIIRLGGSSACYQFFVDLLKQLDKEDLNQLWALVKEYLSIRPTTSEKEMELWNYMHAPVEWKLYDLSGVHHVTAKDKEIFMLVEKDYLLRRRLALVMISYRLQVENYSQMAEDLLKYCQYSKEAE